MSIAWLVPIALGMGVVGLVAFLWSMRSGQYDDLDGAAERVLLSDSTDAPLRQVAWSGDGIRKEPSNEGNTGRNEAVRQGENNMKKRS